MITTITGYVLDTAGTDPRVQQPITISAGETGTVNIVIKHRDGSAFDITGGQLLLTVKRQGTVAISRQATFDVAASGTAHFPLVVADTLSLLGGYDYDIQWTDASGNRYQAVIVSAFAVLQAEGQPAQAVTVPVSQTPLAQGPAGATAIGHIEDNFSAITDGVGNTHEYLDVTFNAPFAAATGAGAYDVDVEISLTTATDPVIGWSIVNKTTTGMRIQFSAAFNGEVRWKAYDYVATTAAFPVPSPSIIAGTGLSGGGVLSADRTLNLANTTVIPGAYTNTNLTVDAQGRITAAANGAGGGGSGTVTSIVIGSGLASTQSPLTTTGTLSIANTAVTPGSYTNTSLTVGADGRITAASSGAGGGTGTVTNVATDATLTGGPITTIGTLGIALGHANAWTAQQTFSATPYSMQVDHDINSAGNINLSGGAGFGLLSAYTSRGYTFNAGGYAQMVGALFIAAYATASRPLATIGAGAQIYDTTLSLPLWSDGANWRDAAGTIR